jgi:hypothetical protein
MPISYALLLCMPIGFVYFLVARFCLRYLMGHYERPERRSALIIGLFGAMLIPTIWILGCLKEEFPTMSGMVISYLLFSVEGLIIAEFIRRSYTKNRDEEREQKQRVEP